MAKALEEIKRVSSVVDAIIYLADSRAPISSINKELLDYEKPIFVLFNKSDKVKRSELSKWKKYYSNMGIKCFPVVSINKNSAKKALNNIKIAIGKKIVYFLVVGVPNVGKSMFIRNSSGSKIKVGARPGVTNRLSWLKAGNGCYLADTPGILWPRMEADELYYKLCAIEAIGDKMVDHEEIFRWLIDYLNKHGEDFKNKYGLDFSKDLEENINVLESKMGKSRKDIFKTVINDYRKGDLGNIILDEIPED